MKLLAGQRTTSSPCNIHSSPISTAAMPTIVASPLTNPMPPLLALQLATGCHTAARLSRPPLQPDQRPQPADLPPADIECPASRDRRPDQERARPSIVEGSSVSERRKLGGRR